MNTVVLAPPPADKPVLPPAPPRRFFLPDIERHAWMVERLVRAYGVNDRQVVAWLRSITESSEFMFLYSENAVALAEVTRQHTLAVQPVLTIRLVWIRPPHPPQETPSKEHLAEAAAFFDEFAKLAKHKNITTLVLEDENLDVPRDMIETKKIGRLFRREQWFAKIA